MAARGRIFSAARARRGVRGEGAAARRQSHTVHGTGLPDHLRNARRRRRAHHGRGAGKSATGRRRAGLRNLAAAHPATAPSTQRDETMNSIRYYAATIVALVLVAALYLLARPTSLPESEAAKLASRFQFRKLPMPEISGAPQKSVRQVHPSLQRISAWISTLGAAVTLADLDGDGLPNDLIHVDPRTDLVTVAPAPGTGERYKPFALDASPLPFDTKTTAPMGTLAGDFNEDGLMDVLIYFWGRTPVILMRKSPEATRAAFVASELSASPERWYSNGATQADLDGDGHVDIVIGNYFQDGGHILDAQAGGVEVMHEGKGKALNGGKKHFFLWQSPGQFKKVEGFLPEEVNRGWTLAIASGDLDGDLLPEIYFAFDFGPDRLLHNRSKPGQLEFAVLEGRRGFLTPKSCVLNNDSFKGM